VLVIAVAVLGLLGLLIYSIVSGATSDETMRPDDTQSGPVVLRSMDDLRATQTALDFALAATARAMPVLSPPEAQPAPPQPTATPEPAPSAAELVSQTLELIPELTPTPIELVLSDGGEPAATLPPLSLAVAPPLTTPTAEPTLVVGDMVMPTPEPWATSAFLPMVPGTALWHNVAAALDASGGALRQVIIAPGETWSFNRAVGSPSGISLVTIAGVYGGGWCDLASRYVVALRPLLSYDAIRFVRHRDATGYDLMGVAPDDAVAIWNTNGGDDEKDLTIYNGTGRALVIAVSLAGDGVTVRARLQ
jgi:hypothetical protein